MRFTKENIDDLFEILVSSDAQIKVDFTAYVQEEYADRNDERLYYVDIGWIAKNIVDRFSRGQIETFPDFFEKVENILKDCDAEIETLVVTGLFEDIQNICGQQVNYYNGFDKWLKPLSKLNWDKVVVFWEGKIGD